MSSIDNYDKNRNIMLTDRNKNLPGIPNLSGRDNNQQKSRSQLQM